MSSEQGRFRVDLRLLRELGERLISRDEVAVVELIKNSYDADATAVEVVVEEDRIEVKDNGEGMGPEEIREGWLTVGTVLKKQRTRTARKRRVLGEKGLGRLAVLRLGREVAIDTHKEGQPCYHVVMDWEMARKQLERHEYTPIEDLAVGVSTVKNGVFTNGHGTRIVIHKLNSAWGTKEVERLQVFLSRLIEPRREGGEEPFQITLRFGRQKMPIGPPEFTEKPHYLMTVQASGDGTYTGLVSWNMEAGHGEKKIEKGQLGKLRTAEGEELAWRAPDQEGCGGFEFVLRVWDLDAKELRGHKAELKQWSGVSLLRDGFRVVQPDVDWLGLDLRRVQVPTLRLSTNQVIGYVSISSDTNPDLIDKTDREGIVENEPFAIMKSAIYHFMNILERERYALRRVKSLSRGVIFSYLDTQPLQQLAKGLPPAQRKAVEEYASRLDDFRGMLEDWVLGRDRMATMGLLGARLIHEARSALMKITDNYPLVEKDLHEVKEPLRGRIERMVEGGRMLSKLFGELDPFLAFRSKRREVVILRDVVTSLEFLFRPELSKNEVRLVNKVPGKLSFKASRTDMYVLLANFLDNSVYWLKNDGGPDRTVEFRGRETERQLIIEVADSGPGVDPANVEMLFDAGFTTKPHGTGLGLSIVRDVVESYGGTVEVNEDGKLGGALFRVTLPLRQG